MKISLNRITDAYDVLSNQKKKQYYDGMRKTQEVSTSWKSESTYNGFYKTTTNSNSYYQQRYSNANQKNNSWS